MILGIEQGSDSALVHQYEKGNLENGRGIAPQISKIYRQRLVDFREHDEALLTTSHDIQKSAESTDSVVGNNSPRRHEGVTPSS